MPSRKMTAGPLRASEILTGFSANGKRVLAQSAESLTSDKILAMSSVKFCKLFGWPLTVNEFLTRSSTQLRKMAEQERKKPSLDKLLAWLETRALAAHREATDLDTRRRLFQEAWHDVEEALAAAYTRNQRDTHEQTQGAAEISGERRQKDAAKWQEYARTVQGRRGDETYKQMATRIQDELVEESGFVHKSEWKSISKADRSAPNMGYVPTIDVIVRFLRKLAKNQPQ